MAAKKESKFLPEPVAIPLHHLRCQKAFSTLGRIWYQSWLAFLWYFLSFFGAITGRISASWAVDQNSLAIITPICQWKTESESWYRIFSWTTICYCACPNNRSDRPTILISTAKCNFVLSPLWSDSSSDSLWPQQLHVVNFDLTYLYY